MTTSSASKQDTKSTNAIAHETRQAAEARRLHIAANRAVRQAIAARDRGDARIARLFLDLAARATDEYLAVARTWPS